MWVWIFNGEGRGLPSGVFSTRERAEAWISQHGLSGILTAYPVDMGALDWAINEGHFIPKNPPSSAFTATFSSGAQEHYHYEGGSTQG
jgi:hypothetical protein